MPVRAPYLSGLVSVPVQVSTVRNGVTSPDSRINTEFTVQAADQLGPIVLNGIKLLTPTTSPQRNSRNRAAAYVQSGLSLMTSRSYVDAVPKLLSAAEELSSITTVSVLTVRSQLASLIAEALARQTANP